MLNSFYDKNRLWLSGLLLLVACLCLCMTNSAVARDDVIKVALVNWQAFPPYTWEDDKSGKVDGFRARQIEAVLTQAGFKFELVIYRGENPNLLQLQVEKDLLAGRIDLFSLPGGVVPEQDGLIRIEHPAFYLKMKAYTLTSVGLKINSQDDLDGLRYGYREITGIQRSPLVNSEQRAPKFSDIKAYDSYSALLNALMQREIDFTMGSIGPFVIHARFNNAWPLITAHDLPALSVPSYWVVSEKGRLSAEAKKLSTILKQFDEQGRTQLIFETAMRDYIRQYRRTGFQP